MNGLLTLEGSNEALKLAVRASMISLLPDFLAWVTKHVDEIVGSWPQISDNDDNIDTTNVPVSTLNRLFQDTTDLLVFVSKIAALPASTRPSLDVFHIVFRRTLPANWRLQRHKIMIFAFFDEILFPICKQLNATHGVQELQEWRAQWTEQTLPIGAYKWNCEPFIARSIQYVNESCARDTTHLVVSKVVEGRLPVELADCILEQALAINCPFTLSVRPCERDWRKYRLGEVRISEKYTCCPHLNHRHPQKVALWSAAERKYIRFHLTSPASIMTSAVTMNSDAFRFTTINGDPINVHHSFWARCSKGARAAGRTNYILVPHGPFPPEEESPHLWEVDHGIGRDWRIVKDCPTEF